MSLKFTKDNVQSAAQDYVRELHREYRWRSLLLWLPWLIAVVAVVVIATTGWSWWLTLIAAVVTIVIAFVVWLFIAASVTWFVESEKDELGEAIITEDWYLSKVGEQNIKLLSGVWVEGKFSTLEIHDPRFAALLGRYQQEEEWLAMA